MEETTKKKIFAGAKIGYGAVRCGSAIALACGHGLLAIAVRKPMQQMHLANMLLKAGQETFKEGVDDWNRLK